MLADFPRYNSKLNYSASVKEIEPIKEIIKCIRNIKVQVGAAPSKKVKLYVKTEKPNVIKRGAVYVEKLAGVSEIEIIENKTTLQRRLLHK
jgi:valyl-tRNA synthetase